MTEKLPVIAEERPADEPLLITDEQREKFLAIVRANPGVSTRTALFEAGVTRTSTWRRRHGKGFRAGSKEVPITKEQAQQLLSDPNLLEDYLYAKGKGAEQIEAEIIRRGLHGWDEPVFHNGQEVGAVRKYDSRLLIAAARANIPKYRDATLVEFGLAGHVNLEDRSASLSDVFALLRAVVGQDSIIDGEAEDADELEDDEDDDAAPALVPG